jgi:hypothetical protein
VTSVRATVGAVPAAIHPGDRLVTLVVTRIVAIGS